MLTMPTYFPNNHRLSISSIWTGRARPLLGVETNLNLAAMPAADESKYLSPGESIFFRTFKSYLLTKVPSKMYRSLTVFIEFAATVYIHVVIVQAEGRAHLVHTLFDLQDPVDQIMFMTESTT